MNLPECGLPKTHKEIVRIMVFSIPCLKDGQATSNTKARAPLPGFSRVIWDEWGKKGVRMDTKALKKQMGAAIAMVLVAAVALGSATFAWFVSNNTVKAETATISAQSNAPFLKIAKTDEELNNTSISFAVAGAAAKDLYPSQVVNGKEGSLVTETTKRFSSLHMRRKRAKLRFLSILAMMLAILRPPLTESLPSQKPLRLAPVMQRPALSRVLKSPRLKLRALARPTKMVSKTPSPFCWCAVISGACTRSRRMARW